MSYDNQLSGQISACEIRRETLSERLKNQKRDLESRLVSINDVLSKLEKNPEICSVLDSVSKLGLY